MDRAVPEYGMYVNCVTHLLDLGFLEKALSLGAAAFSASRVPAEASVPAMSGSSPNSINLSNTAGGRE
jgi:hypothetical protein